MAILNFPDAAGQPIDGSFTYEDNGVLYSWDGYKWTANSEQAYDDRYVEVTGDTMTGDLTVPSLNGGQLAGLRNQIINGDFNIWQRGVPSGSSGSYGYRGPDRWRNRAEINKVPCSLDEFAFCVSIINSAAAGFKQRIEMSGGSQPLAPNSVWTLSCWTEGIGAGQMGQLQIDPDGGASITGTPAIIETRGTWNRWSVTLTMNSSMPSSYAEVSIQSGGPQNWKLTGVQLEPGPVATPFEHRPIGLEQQLCARYFQALQVRRINSETNWYTMPTKMRVRPTGSAETETIYDDSFGIRPGAAGRQDITLDAEL